MLETISTLPEPEELPHVSTQLHKIKNKVSQVGEDFRVYISSAASASIQTLREGFDGLVNAFSKKTTRYLITTSGVTVLFGYSVSFIHYKILGFEFSRFVGDPQTVLKILLTQIIPVAAIIIALESSLRSWRSSKTAKEAKSAEYGIAVSDSGVDRKSIIEAEDFANNRIREIEGIVDKIRTDRMLENLAESFSWEAPQWKPGRRERFHLINRYIGYLNSEIERFGRVSESDTTPPLSDTAIITLVNNFSIEINKIENLLELYRSECSALRETQSRLRESERSIDRLKKTFVATQKEDAGERILPFSWFTLILYVLLSIAVLWFFTHVRMRPTEMINYCAESFPGKRFVNPVCTDIRWKGLNDDQIHELQSVYQVGEFGDYTFLKQACLDRSKKHPGYCIIGWENHSKFSVCREDETLGDSKTGCAPVYEKQANLPGFALMIPTSSITSRDARGYWGLQDAQRGKDEPPPAGKKSDATVSVYNWGLIPSEKAGIVPGRHDFRNYVNIFTINGEGFEPRNTLFAGKRVILLPLFTEKVVALPKEHRQQLESLRESGGNSKISLTQTYSEIEHKLLSDFASELVDEKDEKIAAIKHFANWSLRFWNYDPNDTEISLSDAIEGVAIDTPEEAYFWGVNSLEALNKESDTGSQSMVKVIKDSLESCSVNGSPLSISVIGYATQTGFGDNSLQMNHSLAEGRRFAVLSKLSGKTGTEGERPFDGELNLSGGGEPLPSLLNREEIVDHTKINSPAQMRGALLQLQEYLSDSSRRGFYYSKDEVMRDHLKQWYNSATQAGDTGGSTTNVEEAIGRSVLVLVDEDELKECNSSQ